MRIGAGSGGGDGCWIFLKRGMKSLVRWIRASNILGVGTMLRSASHVLKEKKLEGALKTADGGCEI